MTAAQRPLIPELGSASFFLDEIASLLAMFTAGEDMDDWDLAHAAFVALAQNAWNAHVLIVKDAPVCCPALEEERAQQARFMER